MKTLSLTKEQAVNCIDKKELFARIQENSNGTFDITEHDLRSRTKVNFEKVFFDSFFNEEIEVSERSRTIVLDGIQMKMHDFIKTLFKHFLNEFVTYKLLTPMKQQGKGSPVVYHDSYRVSEKGLNAYETITGKTVKNKHLFI